MTDPAPREARLPPVRLLVRQVALHLGESVVVPLALFYAADLLFGLWPALAVSAAWAFGAVIVHLVRGGRPSSLLVATAGIAVLQIGLTAAARSAVVFYLQPTVATYGFALVLALTSHWERPVIERLAADFCQLPPDLIATAPLRRLFRWLSWLWAGVLGVNATITLVLLLTVPTAYAVPVATGCSVPVFLLGLGLSVAWFRRAVQAAGFRLRWG